MRFLMIIVLAGIGAAGAPAAAAGDKEAGDIYVEDVRFALEELQKNCGGFFELKSIDWDKVSKEFLADTKKVTTDQEHLVLLVRLLARLKDGHASVQPLEKGKDVSWPEDESGSRTGPGMFWCRIGKKIYVKNAWGSASGLKPGMEILTVNGTPAAKWLDQRIEEMSDTRSFSTPQQALFHTCHWGLAEPAGAQMELEVKEVKGQKKKRTITYAKASYVPWGPAFFPEKLEHSGDLAYGVLKSGFGYIHVRRCPDNLPELTDAALAAAGEVPGLILDFRANGGGGFDHEGFMGRFIPAGKQLAFNKTYQSAGPNPYGGPIVVIVDGLTRSAGETGAGMFKEDGRGYLIGESPTAGMSSQKTTIELPSGLFSLYVSVRSNMGRFNGGRGIEGIGVIPHEIVEYDPKDLAEEKDTLIAKAEELLEKFPQKKVPYDPKDFGWTKPKSKRGGRGR